MMIEKGHLPRPFPKQTTLFQMIPKCICIDRPLSARIDLADDFHPLGEANNLEKCATA